ncbi:glycosyltransferase family 2 protein [Rhizobium phaseoli]|uniref:glycosyltransferase n=1 Tax=Rhizobium phaseoli TaxID=396 RepID=UPI000F87B46E|nr:glycosyltransferase [Rhizobium phaseoli]RUM14920.1 glycosyltransferase family 2 protein [Rhizobium phaseoli]
MSTLKATILFATYNGERTLPLMLEALTKATLPHDQWKIVAVDNNSKDNTRAILNAFKDRLPLEIYFEPRQGKENALATGFKHLEGELVIFTDDDIIPEPDWIEAFVRISEEMSDFNVFSGLIKPAWAVTPPEWIVKWAPLNILYADNSKVPVGEIPSAWVHGPNCAYRRTSLGDSYRGNAELGPNASVAQYAMGQDTMFAISVDKKAYHTDTAVVGHIVPADYLSEKWILGRAERYGLGQPVTMPAWFKERIFILGIPAKSTALLAYAFLRYILLQRIGNTETRFKSAWEYRRRLGNFRKIKSLGSHGGDALTGDPA